MHYSLRVPAAELWNLSLRLNQNFSLPGPGRSWETKAGFFFFFFPLMSHDAFERRLLTLRFLPPSSRIFFEPPCRVDKMLPSLHLAFFLPRVRCSPRSDVCPQPLLAPFPRPLTRIPVINVLRIELCPVCLSLCLD